jgi:uncharacterized protein (AIM24 family)
MRPQITGTTLPVLELGLDPGDVIVAAPGELAWMTPNITMNTTTATAGASGLWGAVSRAISGGGLFMTEFSAANEPGGVAFAPQIPGQIVAVDVQPGRGFLIHRHGFLCATQGVELTTGLQRSLGAGIFGGEGFILQRLAGTCQAWVALGGEIVSNELQPGESLLVHPGHVGMFEDSVQFDITTISGIKNALFGGDDFSGAADRAGPCVAAKHDAAQSRARAGTISDAQRTGQHDAKCGGRRRGCDSAWDLRRREVMPYTSPASRERSARRAG